MSKKHHQLYRHFDTYGRLLYIGISNSALTRLSQHRRDKDWYEDIAKMTITNYPSRNELLLAEKEAIVSEKPLYNKQHNTTSDAKIVYAFNANINAFIYSYLKHYVLAAYNILVDEGEAIELDFYNEEYDVLISEYETIKNLFNSYIVSEDSVYIKLDIDLSDLLFYDCLYSLYKFTLLFEDITIDFDNKIYIYFIIAYGDYFYTFDAIKMFEMFEFTDVDDIEDFIKMTVDSFHCEAISEYVELKLMGGDLTGIEVTQLYPSYKPFTMCSKKLDNGVDYVRV